MYKNYSNRQVPLRCSRLRKLLMIMKITTLILITAFLHVSAATLAQKVTLSEKNARLVDVFNDINAQTGYDFAFTTTVVKNAKPVTIQVKNAELSDVLTQILQDDNLDFTIEDKSVVIKAKEASILDNLKDNIKGEFAQITVTGKVVDGTGQPMANVNVKEKGTNNGTVTDNKGKYSISVASDKSIITFSFIGYETQELAAKDIPDGSEITLKAQENNLQEVVISKGYYDEKQELSTGDVSVVTAKTIEEQPVSDPIQALIGRVPGLNIQQTSGLPGSYATINIRGLNSISNGNDPLYIIDGVPFSSISLSSPNMSAGALGQPGSAISNQNGGGMSPFSALNPNDIETIEVLKDADATAIYGSRGANGVILITTKKGKAGATRFTLDANQGAGQVGHFMDLMNTTQYLQMMHQAYANDGLPFPSITSNPSDNYYDIDGFWDTTRNTNWQKALIGGTAQWTNINGNLSGGNANTQFLIGAAYNHQTTVYPGDYGDTKKSIHISITNTSDNQKFSVQLTASYVNDDNIIPTTDYTPAALTLPPDAPALYSPNGSLNWDILDGTSTFFYNPLGPELQTVTSATNNLVSNLHLSYKLMPGLTLASNFGYNHDEMNQTAVTPASSFAPPYNTNPTSRNIDYATTVFQSWNVEPQLSYNHKIAQGTLDALIGTTFQQQQQQSLTQYALGFASDALIGDPSAATYTGVYGDNYALYRYNAVYGRIGYNWAEKYLLNFTVRRDGSSRFGPDRQWGNFGAVGAGWIFSKEKFIVDNLSWINFGKLHGSYGLTGNDQISNYQYLSSYSPNSTTYQGISELQPTRLPNPNYSWETDKKLEGGIDLGFLKDRIDLSLSYYRNRSSNQLVGEPLPYISGFLSVQANLPAVVQNTGLEAELHTLNVKEKDFSWSTNINFTLPENKLISFPGLATSTYVGGYAVGEPLTMRYVWKYTGVNPQTGLYTFATDSPNGVLTSPQDQVIVNPTQKYYGGVQNSFTYKNFSLDIFIQFVKQLGYNYQEYFNDPPGSDQFNQPIAVFNAWTQPGQNVNTEKFSSSLVNYNAYYAFKEYLQSTGVYTNTSFLRIKNAALSYRLPTTWQQWLHVQNAKFYIQGQNLYTFTKYIGLDPESGSAGLPPLRMITAGLSATF